MYWKAPYFTLIYLSVYCGVDLLTGNNHFGIWLHTRSCQSFDTRVTQIMIKRERERKMFYLMTHSTHFIYGYMASDIWLRTILIVRKETRCRHIGYSYRLAARVLLYAPSHRQDNTYHGLCYTSRGALAGTRNSPMKDRSDDPPLYFFWLEILFELCVVWVLLIGKWM